MYVNAGREPKTYHKVLAASLDGMDEMVGWAKFGSLEPFIPGLVGAPGAPGGAKSAMVTVRALA